MKMIEGTCCPLGPEVIQLDLEDISGLAPRLPKQLLQSLWSLSGLTGEHSVDVHRNGGVEVWQLKGGARDQEGGVNLVRPPEWFLHLKFAGLFEGGRVRKNLLTSSFPLHCQPCRRPL